MTTQHIYVGLDDGHSHTKIAYACGEKGDPQTFAFPSCVQRGRYSPDRTAARVYALGASQAVVLPPEASGDQQTPDKAAYHGSDLNGVLIAEALHRICDREGIKPMDVDFEIVVGLPAEDALDSAKAERKKKALASLPLPAAKAGEDPSSLTVSRLNIMPQAVAAILHIDTPGRCLILDIGGGTTDLVEAVVTEDGPIINDGRTASLDVGVNGCREAVAIAAARKAGRRSLDSHAIAEAFDTGETVVNTQIIDVREAREAAIDELLEAILRALPEWADLPLYRNIYLIGGGAKLLHERLSVRHPQAKVIAEPQFANAIGFLGVIQP